MENQEFIEAEEQNQEPRELELIRSIRAKFKEVEKLVEGMQSKLPNERINE